MKNMANCHMDMDMDREECSINITGITSLVMPTYQNASCAIRLDDPLLPLLSTCHIWS